MSTTCNRHVPVLLLEAKMPSQWPNNSIKVSNFDPKIEPACSANTTLGKSYRVLGFIFEGSSQNTEFKILSHFDLIFDKKMGTF